MDFFFPPCQPAIGSTLDETPRVITTKFGDGYTQDTPDGLNNIIGQISLSFTGTPANIDTIVAFFRAHVGQPFYYTMPPGNELRKWVTTGRWSRGYPSATWHTLSVAFEERFTTP